MTHDLLDAQLRQFLGIAPAIEMASFLQSLQRAAEHAGMDARHVAALRGLGPLLDAVSAHYRQTDQDTKAAKARFRELAGISADWYWEQDKHCRFTAISPGFTNATAFDTTHVIGKTRLEAFDADPKVPPWIEHERILARHEPLRDFVYTGLAPDGDTIYISVDGDPVFDANHQFAGYRGIARNITRHKRVEKQLRETLQFTETLLDSMPYPVTVKDREHRFVRINSAHQREFDTRVDAVLGKTAYATTPKEAEAVHAVERQLIENPGTQTMTQTRVRNSGEVRHYVVTKATARDGKGQVTGFITTHVDVTELKAAEARAEEQLRFTNARGLVELMDGELQAESTPGKGSCFRFTVAVDVGGVSAVSESHGAHASLEASNVAGATLMEVLLAEDNKVNQLVATRMLEKLGCKVTVAADGREAVEQASRRHFDLILMDCHMPNMDGFAAKAAIRAMEQQQGAANAGAQRRHIIIAQTANAMEGDRETCLAASMNDYLAKPFSSEKLAAVLRRWVPGVLS